MGMNDSGLYPVEFNVVIEPIETEERTAGGIILTAAEKDKNDLAAQRGRLVAVSPVAFTYADEDEWAFGRKPQPGDTVVFARYAGTLIDRGTRKFRVMKDKDIIAVEVNDAAA